MQRCPAAASASRGERCVYAYENVQIALGGGLILGAKPTTKKAKAKQTSPAAAATTMRFHVPTVPLRKTFPSCTSSISTASTTSTTTTTTSTMSPSPSQPSAAPVACIALELAGAADLTGQHGRDFIVATGKFIDSRQL